MSWTEARQPPGQVQQAGMQPPQRADVGPLVRATISGMDRAGGSRHPLPALLDGLAGLRALDKPAAALRDSISALLTHRGRAVLHGEPLGHPLHPVLAQVPLGAYISAAVLDFMPGTDKRSPDVLIGLGIVASVPAALAGAADYTEADQVQRRVGLVHAVTNGAALGCYLMSMRWRVQGNRVKGKAWALAGLTLAGGSAMLGGDLAFRRKMGTDVTDGLA